MSQTATYDNTFAVDRDAIRFLFHDTAGVTAISNVVTFPLLWDEEYDAATTRWGLDEGAAKLATALASQFEQKVKRFADVVNQFDWPERGDFYLKLATEIRTWGVSVLAGSISNRQPFGYHEPMLTPCTDGRLAFL